MLRQLIFLCVSAFSYISATEFIPLDKTLKKSLLIKGVQLWTKNVSSSLDVACRYVARDRTLGVPHIFDLECPAEIFEQELEPFLKYCEEKLKREGGKPVGLVAVGRVNHEKLQLLLDEKKTDFIEAKADVLNKIQIIENDHLSHVEITLNYPQPLWAVRTVEDIKDLWSLYLIQEVIQERLKDMADALSYGWSEKRCCYDLLPRFSAGVSFIQKKGVDVFESDAFKHLLHKLKKMGHNQPNLMEILNAKSRLQKHLLRFCDEGFNPSVEADYYASFLARSVEPLEYWDFMTCSLNMIETIEDADVIDFLDPLFSEENAYFTISLPSNAVTQKESFKACIETSSSLQMNQEKMTHEEEVELEDDLQLFAKLTITDEEKRMMREVIQTVGRGSEIKLGMMYLSLSKKRAQLMHIHPLRSLATQITDEYTKQCLGKLLDHSMKRDNYLSDFSSKMKEEGAKDNVLKYVDGFCKEVKANPIQVRMYITHQEYEKLIRYLIGIQVAE